MILEFIKFVLESRYNHENVEQYKYYIWANSVHKRTGLIEIIYVDHKNGNITYKILKRSGADNIFFPINRDFFTGVSKCSSSQEYEITISKWKRDMFTNLKYSTNDKKDAYDFFDIYENAKKYNL